MRFVMTFLMSFAAGYGIGTLFFFALLALAGCTTINCKPTSHVHGPGFEGVGRE